MNTYKDENREYAKDLIGSAAQRHDTTVSTVSEIEDYWFYNQTGTEHTDTDAVVNSACRDIDKEIQAIRSRMLRLRILNDQKRNNAVINDDILSRRFTVSKENPKQDEEYQVTNTNLVGQSDRPNPSKQNNKVVSTSDEKQEGEENEVENALNKCEMLLSRIRSPHDMGTLSKPSNMERSIEVPSEHSSIGNDGNFDYEYEEVEHCLTPQVHALETMRKLCRKETRNEIKLLRHDHISAEKGLLQELRVKYESKRKILILSLKRRLEKETASKMDEMIAKLEIEEQSALQNLELQMLHSQDVILQDLMVKSKKKLQDKLECTRARLEAEIASRKFATSKQFELEQQQKISILKDESMQELRTWEEKLRAELEQKMINEREREAELILRDNEERVRNIRQEVKNRHEQRHTCEIEKLKKALNAGVQAQVQSIKQKYSDELVSEIEKMKEDHVDALKMRLTNVENAEHGIKAQKITQVKEELSLKQRLAVEELEQQLRNRHNQELEAFKTEWRAKTKELMEERQKQMLTSHEEDLARLKHSLEQDFAVELHQQEINQTQELQEKLQQLHEKNCEQLRTRLKTKKSQIQQIHSVFLQEANDSYSISTHCNPNTISGDEPDFIHSQDAYNRLKQLHSEPSNEELQKCVDLFLHEFEEILEEHSIMIEKFTASTRVSLMMKKHCLMMEQELNALRSQQTQTNRLLDQKQNVCKKLYDANEALLQRLQLVPPQNDGHRGTVVRDST